MGNEVFAYLAVLPMVALALNLDFSIDCTDFGEATLTYQFYPEFAAAVKFKNNPPTLLWPEGAEQRWEQFNS